MYNMRMRDTLNIKIKKFTSRYFALLLLSDFLCDKINFIEKNVFSCGGYLGIAGFVRFVLFLMLISYKSFLLM